VYKQFVHIDQDAIDVFNKQNPHKYPN